MIYFWNGLLLLRSDTNHIFSNSQWFQSGIIRVSSDEILEQKLWISEVTSIILEWLSVTSDKSFLKISWVPDPFFHVFTLQEMFSLGDKFISTQLNILIEKVAPQNLLSILVVEGLGMQEGVSHNGFGDELEILIVEEHVIIVEEHEWHHWQVHHVLFIHRVVNIQISHIIIPFWIMWVQHQCLQWELWANSFSYVQ